MEIERENGTYRVIEREFELYELQLLVDSVQASKFITHDKAKEITEKLKKLASRYDRKTLERRSYVANRIRNENDSVFYHIDNIHIAIAEKKKISFKYFTYTIDKNRSYMRNGEPYIASPYALLWNDNNYYLIAYEDGKIKHFRVDKMDSIKVLDDEEIDGIGAFDALKLDERSSKVFSMYGGEEERVTLRFRNHLTGVVIDRFGKDILMLKDGENHFTVSVAVEVSPQFYGWLCGLGKAVKIVSPDGVVEKMADYVAGIVEMYKTDKEM